MDFRGKHPIETFQYVVNTENNFLYNGSGSLIDMLYLTTSYAERQVLWEESSSFASSSITSNFSVSSSFASSSISSSMLYNWVPQRVIIIDDAGNSTGSTSLLFDGTALLIEPNSVSSSLKIGTLEFQNYNFNNCWISDNVHFDGGGFVYSDLGSTGEMIYFLNGETQFRNGGVGSPNTRFTTGSQLKISDTGFVALGGLNIVDSVGSTVGATMVVSSSGVNVYRGGLTSSLKGLASSALSASYASASTTTTTAVFASSASWASSSLSSFSASYVTGSDSHLGFLTVVGGIAGAGYSLGLATPYTVQLGNNILRTNTALNSVQIGYGAFSGTASNAVQIGYNAGGGISVNADFSVQIGYLTGLVCKDSFNITQVGASAGSSCLTGSYAVQIGASAGATSIDARGAVQVGASAGYQAINATNSVMVGTEAGYNGGANSVFIGYRSGYNESTSNRLHIGNTITKTLIYGEFDNNLVIINNTLSASAVTASLFGTSSWARNTSGSLIGTVIGALMTMPMAPTQSIDFNAAMFHSSSITSSVYLTASNAGIGKMASFKFNSSASVGAVQTIGYPASWVWLGNAPVALSASKVGVVSLTCYGTSDSDIVGAFSAQL